MHQPIRFREEANAGRHVPETNMAFIAMVLGGIVALWRKAAAFLRGLFSREHPDQPRPKAAPASRRRNQPPQSLRWQLKKTWQRFSAWCWRWRVWLIKVPLLLLLLIALGMILTGRRAVLPLTLAGLLLALYACYRLEPALTGRWRAEPLTEEPLPRSVGLDAALFADGLRAVADVWTPLQRMTHEQFRGSAQALMLSAAAALTVPCLPEAVRGTSAEWLFSLGIRPERYRSRFPIIDEMRLDAFRGVAVKDGKGQRVYLTGDSRLKDRCTRLVDNGRWRPIVQSDREALDALPEDAVYYATAEITHGELDKLLLLGCIRTRTVLKPSFEALAAVDRIREMGCRPLCLLPKAGQPDPVRELELPLEAWDGETDLLRLYPTDGTGRPLLVSLPPEGYAPPEVPRDADRGLMDLLAWQAGLRAFRCRALILSAVTALAALIAPGRGFGDQLVPLAALALIAGFLSLRPVRCAPLREKLPVPGWKTAAVSLLAGAAAAVVCRMFAGEFAPADQLASLYALGLGASCAAVWRLGSLLRLTLSPERKRTALAVSLAAGALALALIGSLSPLGAVFGLMGGLLTVLAAAGVVRLGCWIEFRQRREPRA